jgi:hypothetical protein
MIIKTKFKSKTKKQIGGAGLPVQSQGPVATGTIPLSNVAARVSRLQRIKSALGRGAQYVTNKTGKYVVKGATIGSFVGSGVLTSPTSRGILPSIYRRFGKVSGGIIGATAGLSATPVILAAKGTKNLYKGIKNKYTQSRIRPP